ncbi:coenzyme PQQ synthesis protein D (PqqD) [Rathayibacter iranicus NCPPB 2253 = VKM Ac-1602]|nr:coenzyme PQQ synthesis protein D (PqqD) [Rathayibacter iranicus NCPPB 2253 = VKM Ac-1602]
MSRFAVERHGHDVYVMPLDGPHALTPRMFNETAFAIIQAFNHTGSVEATVAKLSDAYKVRPEDIDSDVRSVLRDVAKLGVLSAIPDL